MTPFEIALIILLLPGALLGDPEAKEGNDDSEA